VLFTLKSFIIPSGLFSLKHITLHVYSKKLYVASQDSSHESRLSKISTVSQNVSLHISRSYCSSRMLRASFFAFRNDRFDWLQLCASNFFLYSNISRRIAATPNFPDMPTLKWNKIFFHTRREVEREQVGSVANTSELYSGGGLFYNADIRYTI
jgi:hypothetical protein